jgi:peptidoglycan/xylan/chitin deacetylase (PgdA/CDA1 family)
MESTMDKIIKKAVEFKPLTALANQLLGHYVTIFMMHRPSSKESNYQGLNPELLDQCLSYAKQHGFSFASIDEVFANAVKGIKPDRPTLCFTIDDGFEDQLNELVPILLKHDAKPTLYVLVNFLDNVDWPWDYKLIYLISHSSVTRLNFTHNSNDFSLDLSSQEAKISSRRALVKYAKYLSESDFAEFMATIINALEVPVPATAPKHFEPAKWDSLREYEKQGLTVGSHACSHRVFSSLSLETVRREVSYAHTRLAAELVSPSKVFCYPSGTSKDYSAEHAPLLKELGYPAAVSAIAGNTNFEAIKNDPYNIKRHSFPSNFDRFVRYASWFEAVRSRLR